MWTMHTVEEALSRRRRNRIRITDRESILVRNQTSNSMSSLISISFFLRFRACKWIESGGGCWFRFVNRGLEPGFFNLYVAMWRRWNCRRKCDDDENVILRGALWGMTYWSIEPFFVWCWSGLGVEPGPSEFVYSCTTNRQA